MGKKVKVTITRSVDVTEMGRAGGRATATKRTPEERTEAARGNSIKILEGVELATNMVLGSPAAGTSAFEGHFSARTARLGAAEGPGFATLAASRRTFACATHRASGVTQGVSRHVSGLPRFLV